MRALFAFLSVLCAMGTIPASAQTPAQREESDRPYVEALRALSPEAASRFEEGSRLRVSGDVAGALRAFREAEALAPTSAHPPRRACGVMLQLGDRAGALRACRHAVELDGAAVNLSALVLALLDGAPSPAERAEAEALAERAYESQPDDWLSWDADLQVSLAAGRYARVDADLAQIDARATPWEAANRYADAARQLPERESTLARRYASRALALDPSGAGPLAADALLSLRAGELARARRDAEAIRAGHPELPVGYFLLAVVCAHEGDFSGARHHLAVAEDHGLPADQADGLRQAMLDSEPFYVRAWPWVWKGALAWLVGLLVLFALGTVLSSLTMKATRTVPADARVSGTSALLRHTYSAVLWLCCAYYYVSIPVLLVGTVLLAGGLIVGAFMVGHVPIKLLLIVGVIAFVTIGSVLRSIFVRGKDIEPGPRLAIDAHPALRETLAEVATKIGTRGVDVVYLTPGTDVAVYERGGLLAQLRGKGERCLILGAGALEGLDVRAFKAILAHEHGHFTNRDTAGGGFALAVRRSLMTMMMHLAQGGAAAWYNPAWLFVQGFFRVFLRISQGASRLQEVLADRWAAFAYGAGAFERGLRHVIARSVRFDAHADATLHEVLERRAPLSNLYTYQPSSPVDEAQLEAAIEEAVERAADVYDSHPAPRERFLLVGALDCDETPTADDSTPAWSLFHDREAVEREMTARVRENVAAQAGIVIPA